MKMKKKMEFYDKNNKKYQKTVYETIKLNCLFSTGST